MATIRKLFRMPCGLILMPKFGRNHMGFPRFSCIVRCYMCSHPFVRCRYAEAAGDAKGGNPSAGLRRLADAGSRADQQRRGCCRSN